MFGRLQAPLKILRTFRASYPPEEHASDVSQKLGLITLRVDSLDLPARLGEGLQGS